jgi:hypothetical protein
LSWQDEGKSAAPVKTTQYYRQVVLLKHPGIEPAWILRVLANPVQTQQQTDGRYLFWGNVPEAEDRVLRVVTLEDKETVHNAFFDRNFRKRQQREAMPT